MAEVAHSGSTPRQPVAKGLGAGASALAARASGAAAGAASGSRSREAAATVAGRVAQPARRSTASARRAQRGGAHSNGVPGRSARSPRSAGGHLSRERGRGSGHGVGEAATGTVVEAAPPGEQPPEHLLPVLEQLLTGATDVTASQRLGMSPRTFSRRVSELLDYLGVLSRFQAGVASVNRGWVGGQLGPSDRVAR